MPVTQQAVFNPFPRTAAARGKVAPTKFAHVVYLTSSYEAMLDWYQRVFEAEPVFRSPDISFLTYDDEHHRIALIRAPGLAAQTPGVAGVHHVAYTFANLEALLATYERLKAHGILPFWPINHGPTISLYYRDPDGNRMEFQVGVLRQRRRERRLLLHRRLRAEPDRRGVRSRGPAAPSARRRIGAAAEAPAGGAGVADPLNAANRVYSPAAPLYSRT